MTRPTLLFDLDGTLVDTAPDLVRVLNRLLAADGRAPMPYAIARNEVSNGAAGLLRLGFGADLDAGAMTELRQRFLDIYLEGICINSRIFIDLAFIVNANSNYSPAWGIVTNKPRFLTEPLLEHLGLAAAPACVISGDSLPQKKPDPAPLRFAAEQLGVVPAQCIYVGDAIRDVAAARAAGMQAVAAGYGYVRAGDDPRRWGADAILPHPRHIARVLEPLIQPGKMHTVLTPLHA